MRVLTEGERSTLTRRGYDVLMGSEVEALVPAAAALGGNMVLVAIEPACVDAQGYVRVTERTSFAAVSDGVLIHQIGVNQARRAGVWVRFIDELYRRWAFRNVLSALDEHRRRA